MVVRGVTPGEFGEVGYVRTVKLRYIVVAVNIKAEKITIISYYYITISLTD